MKKHPSSGDINAELQKLGLSMKEEFVPFSRSRNAKEPNPSLNWKVDIFHHGRKIHSVEYTAGVGHCGAYQANIKQLGSRNCIMRDEAIRRECETGVIYKQGQEISASYGRGEKHELDASDVFYSIVLDSDAINYASFEDWAENFGFDPDSRKAYAAYEECLKDGLILRAALGDDDLKKLRSLFEGY